ncbi:MAG TPA: DUF4406 domain-containing protein [Candidatus Paceibacterota bacterium]
MKVYLAGPMRGYPNFNFPAFEHWAGRLRAEGYEVYSPAEMSVKLFGQDVLDKAGGDESKMGADEDTISRTVFHLDLTYICLNAEAVALLPGWEKSKGATAERAAAIALGLELIYL